MIIEHKKITVGSSVALKASLKKIIEVHVIGSKRAGKTTTIQWLKGDHLTAKKDEETAEWKHEVREILDEKSMLPKLEEKSGEISYQEEHVVRSAEKWDSNTCLLIVLPYHELSIVEQVFHLREVLAILKILRNKNMFNTVIENNTIFIIPYQGICQIFDVDKFLGKKIKLLKEHTSEESLLLISLLTEMKASRKNKLFMLSASEICDKGASKKLAMIKQFYLNTLLEIEKSESSCESTLPEKQKATSLQRDNKDTRKALVVRPLNFVNTPFNYFETGFTHFINKLDNQARNEKTLIYAFLAVSILIMARLDTDKQLAIIELLLLSLLIFNKIIKPGLDRMSRCLNGIVAGATMRMDELLRNLNSILKTTDTNLTLILNSFKKVLDSFNMSIEILTDRTDKTLQLSADQIKLITENLNGVIKLSEEQAKTLNTNLNKILVVTYDQIMRVGAATSHSIRLTGEAIQELGGGSERFLQLTGEQIKGIGSQTNQLVRLTSEQMGRLGHGVDRLLVLSGQEVQAMRQNLTRIGEVFCGEIQGVKRQFDEQLQRFIQSRDRGLSRVERSTVDTLTDFRGSVNDISNVIQDKVSLIGTIMNRDVKALLRDFNESLQRLTENIGNAAEAGRLFHHQVDVHDNPVNVSAPVSFCIIQ